MPYLTANGTDLYYEVHGEGAPVVFAHGMGGSHASWFQQLPFFSRSYQVVSSRWAESSAAASRCSSRSG
jgi:pimeloyl-ACP methyl ester carboxylesterase